MTVGELINELKKFNPSDPVLFYSSESWGPTNIIRTLVRPVLFNDDDGTNMILGPFIEQVEKQLKMLYESEYTEDLKDSVTQCVIIQGDDNGQTS